MSRCCSYPLRHTHRVATACEETGHFGTADHIPDVWTIVDNQQNTFSVAGRPSSTNHIGRSVVTMAQSVFKCLECEMATKCQHVNVLRQREELIPADPSTDEAESLAAAWTDCSVIFRPRLPIDPKDHVAAIIQRVRGGMTSLEGDKSPALPVRCVCTTVAGEAKHDMVCQCGHRCFDCGAPWSATAIPDTQASYCSIDYIIVMVLIGGDLARQGQCHSQHVDVRL